MLVYASVSVYACTGLVPHEDVVKVTTIQLSRYSAGIDVICRHNKVEEGERRGLG